MALSTFHGGWKILLAMLSSYILLVEGTRGFSQRRDLQDVPPVSTSGYTVPLQGGKTCYTGQNCTDTLSAPPAASKLQYLAIARGFITYSCASRTPTQPPVYVAQDTSLYDAAPLIATFSNEMQLHQLIPHFLEFDYTALKNSTLSCIGNIDTYQGSNVIDLFSIDVFPVDIQQKIHAPTKPDDNLDWAHSTSNDNRWDIYRVVTAGGAPPQTCHGQTDLIELDYAAEYWFYRFGRRTQMANDRGKDICPHEYSFLLDGMKSSWHNVAIRTIRRGGNNSNQNDLVQMLVISRIDHNS